MGGRESILAKADLLEKKLSAKETEIAALLGQKESVVAEADQLKKKVKEKETESAGSLASEKKKAVDEAGVLRSRLEAAAAVAEIGNLRQALQLNNHTMVLSGKNKDKATMDIKIEELEAALAKKEELIEALRKELAANQDHLRKVEKESVIKEERLQEKDSVIKTLKGYDGNSVALAKKINKLKKRDRLKDEMLNIRDKEIELLRRVSPKESESEEENENSDRKGASSMGQAENGVEEEGFSKKKQSFPIIPIPHYTEESPGEILEKAKQLKHRGDRAECLTTKVQSYLSAIRLFLKSSLITNKEDGSRISQDGSNKVLKQTLNLTKMVYKLCMGKATSEELAEQLSVYTVLVLRTQSLIEWHLCQQNSNGHPVPVISHPTWKLADQLVSQDDCIRDSLDVLELECGSLTPQSSLGQLVGYLETALQKLPKSP